MKTFKLSKNRHVPLFYITDKAGNFLCSYPHLRWTKNNAWAISFFSDDEAQQYYKRMKNHINPIIQ